MAKIAKKEIDDTFYIMQAAKMIVWHVDINERVIYVPQDELEAAFDTMMVKHLCTHNGFHVQSCIPDESPTKKVCTTRSLQLRTSTKRGQNKPLQRRYVLQGCK